MSLNGTKSNKVLSPATFVHIVLRTQPENVHKMTEFYTTFLGGHAVLESDIVSFITYDDEHHRVAIVGLPDTAAKQPKSCGLEHFAFSYNTLHDLMLAYRQRKAHGMNPVWCINHGPTTSIYFADPDGNKIETQVNNFSVEEANAFMFSKAFEENPIGVDFDPEQLIERLEAGEDEAVLKKRPDIGPRGPESMPGEL